MNRAYFSENTTLHENNYMRVPSDLIKSNYLQMKTHILRFIFFCILITSHAILVVSAGSIVYPWRAVKAIVQNGNNFNILFNNINWTIIDSVILEGPFNRVILQIDSVLTGRFEYDSYTHASVNNKIWAHVPSGTPEELYNLIVKSGGETHLSLKSVKVIREFKEEHCFIHITDLHMTRQWVGTPESGYAKELELFDNFIKVANIIAPDFVIVTGDNIHHYTRIDADSTGWGGTQLLDATQRPLVEEKWKNLYEGSNGFSGIDGLNSPVFLVPGNHDYYGVEVNDYKSKANQWNYMCGLRVYGFSYAGTRIVAIDNFLGDTVVDIPHGTSMSGLQGKVLESFFEQYGHGLISIMAQHRNEGTDTAFINKHRINILLNGHDHTPFQEYIGTTPTLSIRPGVVCRSGVHKIDIDKQLGFFRIFRIHGSSFEFTQPLRFTKDPTVPYQKMELNLTLNYSQPNDGTSFINNAVIVNNFGIELPACHIRFIMKKGKYKVNNGLIYQVIESGKFSVVDVRVDVSSGKLTEVKIRKI